MNEEMFINNLVIFISLITIIVVGIFGNILNLIIFRLKSMRSKSTFMFLFYLALIDLLVINISVLNYIFIELIITVMHSLYNIAKIQIRPNLN